MSVMQRSYSRDRVRYPTAVGCLMWWGLFTASLAGYLLFFFIMAWYKPELGSAQLCPKASLFSLSLCNDQNVIIPIVAFAVLFLSQLYMVYLVESRKKRSAFGQTIGMLAISMILLPVFGTVAGLYLIIRLATDPQTRSYYSEARE